MEKICPKCNNPMVLRTGVSKKTKTKFEFWGCSSYPDCEHTEKFERVVPAMPSAGSTSAQEAFLRLDKIVTILNDILIAVLLLTKKDVGKKFPGGPSAIKDDIPIIEEDAAEEGSEDYWASFGK